jgi:hypothetical protein
LSWQATGSSVQLRLRGHLPWQVLLPNAIFVGLLLTDNPWSRAFRPLLLGQESSAFPRIFSLVFWAGIALTLGHYAWLLLSRETLTVEPTRVLLTRHWLGLSLYQRQVPLAAVQHVRVAEPPAAEWGRNHRTPWSGLGFGNGAIRLETPGEELAFGRSLDPAEARAALLEISQLGLLPRRLFQF